MKLTKSEYLRLKKVAKSLRWDGQAWVRWSVDPIELLRDNREKLQAIVTSDEADKEAKVRDLVRELAHNELSEAIDNGEVDIQVDMDEVPYFVIDEEIIHPKTQVEPYEYRDGVQIEESEDNPIFG